MRETAIGSISIVGLGLIGASVLRAFRKSARADGRTIIFKGYDPAFGPEDVDHIGKLGLDRFEADADKLYDADLIILAAPVLTNIALLDDVARLAPEHALVSDVSSTKQMIADRATELGLNFIGMHPIAGRERQGYRASDDELLAGKTVVLCTNEDSGPVRAAAGDLVELLESIRCRVVFMSAVEHDRVVANISHLPQLLSTALINHCAENIDKSGPGFSTLTRLAASPWEIWRDIVATNSGNIASELRSFGRELLQLAEEIERGNPERTGERFGEANNLYRKLTKTSRS